MARTVKDAQLETRTARLKHCKAGKRHLRGIRSGLALTYRRAEAGSSRSASTWSVRLLAADGRYVFERLGSADDYADANGLDVLDYAQAQDKARAFADRWAQDRSPEYQQRAATVATVMEKYLAWYKLHRRAYTTTERAVNVHILPAFGGRAVASLTKKELCDWRDRLAAMPARKRTRKGRPQAFKKRKENDGRARKATVNRILTILKAGLNFGQAQDLTKCEPVWHEVKKFRKVESVRIRYLSAEECRRLVNAMDKDFQPMVQAALHTGARYGELAAAHVEDYSSDAGSLALIRTKSERPRHVPLTDAGRKFFEDLTARRAGSELLFARAEGGPWLAAHQTRRMVDACAAAKITPHVGFHTLRHTYGATLAMKGVPLQVIAAVLGHADTRVTEMHYAHLQPSYVADTIRANLPDLAGGTESKVVKLRAKR